MSAKRSESGSKQPSFEEAMQRLEAIVSEMESGKVSLDVMIKRFEEGQQLIALCTNKLNEVEKKVEILVKKSGKVVAEKFAAPDLDAGLDDVPEEEDDDVDDDNVEELF